MDNKTLPKTAQEARAINSMFYMTGRFCVGGHKTKRRTNGNNCVECEAERSMNANKNRPDRKKPYKTRKQINLGEVFVMEDLKKTKALAKAAGDKFFFNGIPCRKANHTAPRRTGSGACYECVGLHNEERKNKTVAKNSTSYSTPKALQAESDSSEERLYWEILKRAVRDLDEWKNGGVDVNWRRELVRLLRWFNSKSEEELTFRWICMVIDADPDVGLSNLRTKLLTAREALSRA